MVRALATVMKAKNLSDVVVYHKALDAQRAVCAYLKRPALRKDYNLWDQMSRSSARVPALIAEGFGQRRTARAPTTMHALADQLTSRTPI
jgi:four helix bundle protein